MPDYNFDAPIPGQSLTMHPGSLALEHPPQFTDPNDAAEFLWKQLTSPKQVVKLVLLLRDTPVEYIARTVLYTGVINGKWTPDLAMLLFNVCMWQIEAIAKTKKIKYKTLNDDTAHTDFLSNYINILDEKTEPSLKVSTPTKGTGMFKGLLG